ncbi:MAG: thiolase family protein [Patescibacteria group bacterium]
MSRKRGVYILGAKRTPFGKFFGSLKDISVPWLAGLIINKMLEDCGFSRGGSTYEGIDGVILGQVLTAGSGQAPARQAALLARLSETCPAETVNKVCASSLFAIKMASREIQVGEAGLMIAGGMESMSRAPYLVTRRVKNEAFRIKNSVVMGLAVSRGEDAIDSMVFDGLVDPGVLRYSMGDLADTCAIKYQISREAQESYAYSSFERAYEAQRLGKFDLQIGCLEDYKDECIREPDLAKMQKLSPAFSANGTVTAATSSQIADGAAVMLLGDSRTARKRGLTKLVRSIDFATHSQDPRWFTTAPVGAIKKILLRNRLRVQDVSLFEINEAFAVVPIYAMRELGIPHEKLNIWGGAIALGHPLGASGARIVMNLMRQLHETGGRYGIACACNGGGEAMAVLVENMQGRA